MAQVPSERDECPPEHASLGSLKEFISKLPTREGWSGPIVLYKDYWFRPQLLENILLAQKNYNPRSEDIILATQPKSGTTWLKALSFTIINRSHYGFSDHPLLTRHPQHVVPFIEIPLKGKHISYVESLPSPRLLATHMPLSFIPAVSNQQSYRVVYICRDPKDVFVSRWYFENKIFDDVKLDMGNTFDMFCQGISPYGPFWSHFLEYWKASIETPERVMFLKYEDLKSDPVQVVKKLAHFFSVPFTREEEAGGVLEQVVKLCDFETLASLKVNQNGETRHDNKIQIDNSVFFRKGTVGDWVNLMSEEMGARLDQIVQDKLQGSGLTF
ncbi:cytosolic sulfotransferase 17-like [Oryza brachyantha]|uniref:Sulfotransferase n=1 Tax=Oryza brachyantha TaxID=4533 RepID=J3MVW9_ORYBR|nr:cytosolic sulfotransferase 17-like [Oryza brachyantha]